MGITTIRGVKKKIALTKLRIITGIKMLNKDLINKFSDGIRLILISNRNGNYHFFVSRHKQEFEQYVKEEYKKLPVGFRIYSSINKRNLEKAIRKFKEQQLKADYIPQMKNAFYTRIERYFISALADSSSRDEKKYLIDIDDISISNEIQNLIYKNNIKPIYEYNTITGKHIIVEPFNVTLIPSSDKVQVLKDGMLLLGWN
jgi:hypothetical protein